MKDKKVLNIVSLIVATVLIIIPAVMGFGFIYGYTDNIGVRDPKFRNLSLVKVYGDNKKGEGVIVYVDDEYADIITCKHIFETDYKALVEFGNKESVYADVTYYFPDVDACVIRLKRSDIKDAIGYPVAVPFLGKNDYSKLSIGEKVYYSDDLNDLSRTFNEGLWISSDEFVYELEGNVGLFSGEVVPGMSGSGVFDEDGKLIGIIVASNEVDGALLPAFKLMDYRLYLEEEK